jgi:hydrogenase expression/formation protein HypC
MCLAVPALILQCEGDDAVADLHGNRVPVCTTLVPDAGAGDWVLVHAGFAIRRLDPDAARQTWAVLEDLDRRLAADPSAQPGRTQP